MQGEQAAQPSASPGEVWGAPEKSGEVWGDPGRSGELHKPPQISGDGLPNHQIRTPKTRKSRKSRKEIAKTL